MSALRWSSGERSESIETRMSNPTGLDTRAPRRYSTSGSNERRYSTSGMLQ
jgi:hypothetical protein